LAWQVPKFLRETSRSYHVVRDGKTAAAAAAKAAKAAGSGDGAPMRRQHSSVHSKSPRAAAVGDRDKGKEAGVATNWTESSLHRMGELNLPHSAPAARARLPVGY